MREDHCFYVEGSHNSKKLSVNSQFPSNIVINMVLQKCKGKMKTNIGI